MKICGHCEYFDVCKGLYGRPERNDSMATTCFHYQFSVWKWIRGIWS